MQLLNSLYIAFSMYSKIPVPRADWSEKNMRYVMACFPLVGVVIGLTVWLAGNGLELLPFGKTLKTVILVLIPIFLTGGIHLDGFFDTVDACSSWQSKERRLEILEDAHTGAFAIIAAAVYFLLDFGIWSEVAMSLLPILACGFVLSRILSGYAVVCWKRAKTGGLAAGFQHAADKRYTKLTLCLEGAALIGIMFEIHWRAAVVMTTAAILSYGYYHHMAYKNFGGITGDLAGWFLQVCELAMAGSLVLGDKIWY